MRAWVRVVVAVGSLALPATARADAGAPSRVQGPCAGCRSSLPGAADPSPLLVVLHGDGESAGAMFEAWAPAAEARGIAVLAPACPRSEGCTSQSWWRWNGSPSWLTDQVRALAGRRPLDPARMWLVGWSGGASYIGFRTQELESTFAAVVLHGGGIPPARASCSSPRASVYFLVGDANPLHHLAVELRDYYRGCDHDVTWTLLAGADHDGERRALPSHREAILDWLSTKRLATTPVSPPAVDSSETPPVSSAPTPATSTTPALPSLPPTPPGSRTSCRCSTPDVPAGRHEQLAWLLCAAVTVLARQRRSGRTPSTR